MQFLTPLFFLGALAVAGPILLHLVRRDQRNRMLFPSLMFLRRVPIQEYRRRKLRYLLLLFLRCLGLLLLVAAFASPVTHLAWFGAVSGQVSRSLVVLLDNSMSMARPGVWERALEKARAKIGSMQGTDQACLILFAARPAVLSAWESRSARLLQILEDRAEPSFESTSYLEGLRAAAQQFDQEVPGRREIYLITDLQRTAMPRDVEWSLDGALHLEVEDVGEPSTNVFIQEADLQRLVYSEEYPQPVRVQLRSAPPGPARGELQLFVEGRMLDRQTFEMDQEGSAPVTLRPFELKEGIFRGRLVLAVEDAMEADNIFHFVVERTSPGRIRVLSDQGTGSVYLRNALGAGRNLPFVTEFPDPRDTGELDPELVPLVILDDLRTPPASGRLSRYLEAGGGLIVAPGRRVDGRAYNRLAYLPARLAEPRFVRGRGRSFTSITQVDWSHPAFAIFQDLQRTALASVRFYGHWRLEPREDSRVLGRFDEGDPALVEGQAGGGRVLVLAWPLDRVWSDFPLRPAFLPFWQSLAHHMGGVRPQEAALRVDQSLAFREEPAEAEAESGARWNVLDPRGRRVVDLDQPAPAAIDLQLPGHYEIRKDKKTDWVAVNPDPSESDIQPLPVAMLLDRFQAATPAAGEGVSGNVAEADAREPLWWLFLLAAVVVLAAESVVAGRTRLR